MTSRMRTNTDEAQCFFLFSSSLLWNWNACCSFCLRFHFRLCHPFYSICSSFFVVRFFGTRSSELNFLTGKILPNNQICDDSCNDFVCVCVCMYRIVCTAKHSRTATENVFFFSKRLKYCGWFNDNYWTCALRKRDIHYFVYTHLGDLVCSFSSLFLFILVLLLMLMNILRENAVKCWLHTKYPL